MPDDAALGSGDIPLLAFLLPPEGVSWAWPAARWIEYVVVLRLVD